MENIRYVEEFFNLLMLIRFLIENGELNENNMNMTVKRRKKLTRLISSTFAFACRPIIVAAWFGIAKLNWIRWWMC